MIRAYPLVARTLFYAGSSMGFGESIEDAYFLIRQNDVVSIWSPFQTLARLAEFSPDAQACILSDCAVQRAYEIAYAAGGVQ